MSGCAGSSVSTPMRPLRTWSAGGWRRLRLGVAGGSAPPSFDDLVEDVRTRAASRWQPWPRPVINATGVILHTNLGRSPLSLEAAEAVRRAATGYTDLEMDLDEGVRGSRQSHAERLLRQLTGAEASLVVNNNASAILLSLSAIACEKEVIVSRGEGRGDRGRLSHTGRPGAERRYTQGGWDHQPHLSRGL